MKGSSIFGLVLLSLLWIWLSWALLYRGGLTLYNILIVAMSGMIVFIPLYRKYKSNQGGDAPIKGDGGKKKNNGR